MESNSETDNDSSHDEETYGLTPYLYEPSISKISHSYDEIDTSSDEILAISKRGVNNYLLCQSDKCCNMGTETESVCCREISELANEKFGGKKCITEMSEFDLVCLNDAVIRTTLVAL